MDYIKLQQRALNALKKYGSQMILEQSSVSDYDPATATAAKITTRIIASGVCSDYTFNEIDGTKVQSGDVRVWLSAAHEINPASGNVLIIAGLGWQVVSSKALNPAGAALLHDVLVRRL